MFLIPYTASVYNGLSRLFGMAFALPYDVCVIGMAVVTCVYVVLGGYMATVMNDFIQGIVMLLGIIAVIVAVILNNGGFSEAIISLSQIPAEGSAMQGPFVSFFGPDLFNLLGVVILTSLGTWGLPQMVQKFYAIKTGPAIKQGAIISTIFAFVVAGGSYFLGGFGRLYEGQIEYAANGTPIYDSIIPTMLSTLPDVLIGLVIVLVLSASMSTLSSLVLTSSSTLTIDFINGNIIKNMSEKKQLVWMRGLLVVFIAISALIALFQYHSSVVFIAQLMGYSWGALAGSFLGPFLWGLYSGRISKASVWCSFAVGVGLTAVNMGLALSGGTPLIASPINCGALCMIISLVIRSCRSLSSGCAVCTLTIGPFMQHHQNIGALDGAWCSSPSRRSSRCSSTTLRWCSSPSSWATLGVRWPARSSAPSCGVCTPDAFRRRACGARSPWAWV